MSNAKYRMTAEEKAAAIASAERLRERLLARRDDVVEEWAYFSFVCRRSSGCTLGK